jgi:hypothetical protein
MKGATAGTSKALGILSEVANRAGIVSGLLDVGQSGVDLYNTVTSDSSPNDVARAATKFVVKAAILAIGYSNPVTGAILGVADAFGATDALVNWMFPEPKK